MSKSILCWSRRLSATAMLLLLSAPTLAAVPASGTLTAANTVSNPLTYAAPARLPTATTARRCSTAR